MPEGAPSSPEVDIDEQTKGEISAIGEEVLEGAQFEAHTSDNASSEEQRVEPGVQQRSDLDAARDKIRNQMKRSATPQLTQRQPGLEAMVRGPESREAMERLVTPGQGRHAGTEKAAPLDPSYEGKHRVRGWRKLLSRLTGRSER